MLVTTSKTAQALAHLPRLPLDERKSLPHIPAIYFVLTDDRVMYVGRARDLGNRWRGVHHRLKQVVAARTFIAWGALDPQISDWDLSIYEHLCIAHFRPRLNDTPVAPKAIANTRPTASSLVRLEARVQAEILACQEQQDRIIAVEHQRAQDLKAALRWLHGYEYRLTQVAAQCEQERDTTKARLLEMRQACDAFLPRKQPV